MNLKKLFKLRSKGFKVCVLGLALFSSSASAGLVLVEQELLSVSEESRLMVERITEQGGEGIAILKTSITEADNIHIKFLNGKAVEFSSGEPRNEYGGLRYIGNSLNGSYFSLLKRQGRVSGNLSFGGEQYSILKGGKKGYIIIAKSPEPTYQMGEDGKRVNDVAERNFVPCNEIYFTLETYRIVDDCEPDIIFPPGGGGSTTPAGPFVTRVLIAFANKAAANHYNNDDALMLDRANVLINEMNGHLFSSEVNDVMKVELAGIYRFDRDEYYQEYDPCDDVWGENRWGARNFLKHVVSPSIDLKNERLRVNADVFIVIADLDDPAIGGLAQTIKAKQSNAFAIVESYDVRSYWYQNFTFSHEIGHLIGLHHERQTSPALDPYPYGHGYKVGGVARSIMSYDCYSGCPLAGVFSNPDVNFLGTTTPSGTNNNTGICYGTDWPWSVGHCKATSARIIRQRAEAMSKLVN